VNGDGKQTRDYVYVGDVARMSQLALETDATGPVNVGTGIETDVNQVYASLARAAGSAAQPVHAEARLGEQKRSCVDPGAALRALGWRPQVALDDGLARTLDFFRAKRR